MTFPFPIICEKLSSVFQLSSNSIYLVEDIVPLRLESLSQVSLLLVARMRCMGS